jgi:hypothetical protein
VLSDDKSVDLVLIELATVEDDQQFVAFGWVRGPVGDQHLGPDNLTTRTGQVSSMPCPPCGAAVRFNGWRDFVIVPVGRRLDGVVGARLVAQSRAANHLIDSPPSPHRHRTLTRA